MKTGLAVRIFLSYWAMQAILLASFALLPDEGAASGLAYLVEQNGRAALGLLQANGRSSCDDYAAVLEEQVGVVLRLASTDGELLCGRTSTSRAAEPRRAADRQQEARLELTSGNETIIVVGQGLPDRYRRPGPPFPYWPLGFTLLVSGVFCYLVARWLTRPLSRIRDASHRLAAGDLRARVYPEGMKRHDEIGDLVRDFDVMASRLERLVDAQGRILSDISHELRSPLARLGVALELAHRRASPDAAPHLERIEMEAQRMNDLIGRVLSLARAEVTPPPATRIDLKSLLEKVVADARYEAEGQRRQVSLHIDGQPTLLGDATLVASAVDNVVRNALRHTAEQTAVTIDVSAAGRDALVVVRDHGQGVPAAELDRIFLPFHRAEFARNRDTGGVGLGLAIASRAVHIHGGAISAANHPAGGLVVTIRLPLADKPLQNNAKS